MGAILAIIGVIATSLLGYHGPWNLGGSQTGTPSDNDVSSMTPAAACRPSINTNRLVQVNVKDELNNWYSNNQFGHPEFNKEEEIWVLVKENAPIPAWKVKFYERGQRNGNSYAEMEHLGTSIGVDGQTINPDINKDVYIGVGWCNPETSGGFFELPPGTEGFTPEQMAEYNQNACLDPLVQDVIFVVNRKGAETNFDSWLTQLDWPLVDNPNPPRTMENLEQYFWSFNVYYKKSKLPGSPSYSDLPCWMRTLADQCPNAEDVLASHRLALWDVPGCENENVLAAIDPQNPAPELVIAQAEFHNIDTSKIPPEITLANHYISVQGSKTYDPPDDDPIIAQAYESRTTPGKYYFNVRLRRGTVSGTATDHVVILDPRISGHEGPYWIFSPILDTSKPFANSLQLGSFVPGIPSFFYEWWTPACKPALYLYPEKETALSVKVLPHGHLTESIPPHGVNGWNVIAYPDGSLFSAVNHKPLAISYLYYEAALDKVTVSKDDGWIKTREDLPAFFHSILPTLGLNEKESQDFKDYWLPKLQSEGTRWYITLISRDELDRVEPIQFSTPPDTFIRVRFYFENLDDETDSSNFTRHTSNFSHNISSDNLQSPLLSSAPERNGFTVTDWGGIMGNGTCGVGETSE